MQLRRVNRKQLFVEALNHEESFQEAVTEKAAGFITGLRVYMNPQAQINKPLAGSWAVALPAPSLCPGAAGEAVGWGWASTDLSSGSGPSFAGHHTQITQLTFFVIAKAPSQPFDRSWTHKSSSTIPERL